MVSNLHCQTSERALIGCLVASGGEAFENAPATEEHFFDSVARGLFQAFLGLHTAGAPVNTTTVMQRLGMARIEELGGTGEVSDACHYPAPSQAAHFFAIVDGKLSLRRARELGRWAVAESEGNADPGELVAELQRRAVALESQADAENVLQPCLRQIGEKLDRMQAGTVVEGMKTSLEAWNRAFGGIMDGQLYGIAGRPGLGKSALMEMLIEGYLRKDIPVCVFEKDMSPQKLLERMACRLCDVPYWRFARGMLFDDAMRRLRGTLEVLGGSRLYLYNPHGLTADRLCAIARRDIRQRGVRAVFLDHIQALRVGKDYREGLTQASLTIRDNVTTTNVPHIVLAHVNRNGAKGRPAPEDIKEFDQLYGDADGMIMLWSEKARAELEKGEPLPVNFYVAKNRDGEVTEDELLFDGANLKFSEPPPAPTNAKK